MNFRVSATAGPRRRWNRVWLMPGCVVLAASTAVDAGSEVPSGVGTAACLAGLAAAVIGLLAASPNGPIGSLLKKAGWVFAGLYAAILCLGLLEGRGYGLMAGCTAIALAVPSGVLPVAIRPLTGSALAVLLLLLAHTENRSGRYVG